MLPAVTPSCVQCIHSICDISRGKTLVVCHVPDVTFPEVIEDTYHGDCKAFAYTLEEVD